MGSKLYTRGERIFKWVSLVLLLVICVATLAPFVLILASSLTDETTLITYGYSFGDEHINRVIRDMLTVPSTHLVIIAYNDPLGRIMKTYQELGRPSQISLLIGPALADLQILTESFLPKAAIDKTTFRMSELLKQRFGTETHPGPAAAKPGSDFDGADLV